MNSKVTLSFDKEIIKEAKKYASSQGISLSRLTEVLYRRIIDNQHDQLEELPIAEWVYEVAEGTAEYKTGKASRKKEYFESRKK